MLTSFDMALGAVVVLGVIIFGFAISVALFTRRRVAAVKPDPQIEIPELTASPQRKRTPERFAGAR